MTIRKSYYKEYLGLFFCSDRWSLLEQCWDCREAFWVKWSVGGIIQVRETVSAMRMSCWAPLCILCVQKVDINKHKFVLYVCRWEILVVWQYYRFLIPKNTPWKGPVWWLEKKRHHLRMDWFPIGLAFIILFCLTGLEKKKKMKVEIQHKGRASAVAQPGQDEAEIVWSPSSGNSGTTGIAVETLHRKWKKKKQNTHW